MTLPANINVNNARLPASYEQAKVALAKCNDIDECVDWADKAAALASYAKQAEDDGLERMATRIRARAVRRAGELLQQVDGRGGDRSSKSGGAPTSGQNISQRALANQAGMSRDQQVQAVRVAKIPEDDFERAIESDERVTVTKLAGMGKQTRPTPDYRQGIPTDQFQSATHTMGAMRRFAEKCAAHDAAFVAGGVLAAEAGEARSLVASIDAWLDRFVVSLKG